MQKKEALKHIENSLTPFLKEITTKQEEKEKKKLINSVYKSTTSDSSPKGRKCSENGKKYEKIVYSICNSISFKNKTSAFCNKTEEELAGCGSGNDIECQYKNTIIPIEIKSYKSPDWMQMALIPDLNNKSKDGIIQWKSSSNAKIPEKAKELFNNMIEDEILFNNKIPPFFEENMTHEKWVKLKKKKEHFKDHTFKCSSDFISQLYSAKGCFYIQVSEMGLYHTGNDICNFGVPKFEVESELRVRIKIHSTGTKTKDNCMRASVTISAKPINLKTNLEESNYSLDNINKIPKKLVKIKT